MMDTILPAALLGIAVTNLAVAAFSWGAGGKHQVLSSLIIAALALGMLLPDGSGRSRAALWVACGLVVVAVMTTPGARLRRMRLELSLMAAGLAVMWTLTLVELPHAAVIAGLVLMASLILAAFGAMVVRGKREESR